MSIIVTKQRPTKQQLYEHLPPISQIIQVRRARHTRHCWRHKDKLQQLSIVSSDRPLKTYFHRLCVDTVCPLEDLLRDIANRDGWPETLKAIHAISMT